LRPLKINLNENMECISTPALSSTTSTEENEKENTENLVDYQEQTTLSLNMVK